MRRLLIILSLLIFGIGCWSCAADLATTITPPATVKVELHLQPDPAQQITRATDESSIRDVNLYLFGRTNAQSLHLYSHSGLLRFECMPGQYDLYVATNLGTDLGELNAQQLLDYTIEQQNDYSTLPMTAATTLSITPEKGSNTVTLPTLSVRRNVAKVVYNIRVADNMPDLELQSVQLRSIRKQTALFTPAKEPSTAAKDFTDGPIIEIPEDARQDYSGIQYLFENPQSEVPSITEQQDKNALNAPAYASYLMIRAVRGNHILDYRVYLGQNNTTDFNVRRNTAQTLDITILGDEEVDTRVHGYTLNVTDDFESNRIGDYCVLPFNASLYVNIERTDTEPSLTGEVELLTATDGPFLVDYEECNPRYNLSLYYQQGSNYYELVYYPKVISQANAQLAYEVRVRDSYGYQSHYRFEHRFANALHVAPCTGGAITVARALDKETSADGSLRAVCYETGCTLTAQADEGYRFEGWYADEDYTKLLSEAEKYPFVPQGCHTSLYPRFAAEEVRIRTDIYSTSLLCEGSVRVDQSEGAFIVPKGSQCTIRSSEPALFSGWYNDFDLNSNQFISSEKEYSFVATQDRIIAPKYIESVNLSILGTANCYVVSEHNATYAFSATVQGNGKATTGITPQPLSGAYARLIWQTGNTPDAIIREVGYNGRRISFKTGPEYGNALIGLFDAEDVCIWSWHIWATDADLERTSRLYSTGARFMGRNLGAESADSYDYKCRGMYYEWGRKEPFPYPGSQNGSSMTTVHYGEGFSFDTYHPQAGDQITSAWAVAHPTTFIAGTSTSWLSQANPNLWGNASTGSTYSKQSSKSIYDPCPPGWRLPGPEAWNLADFKGREELKGYGWYVFYDGLNAIYHPYVGELSTSSGGKAMFSYTTSWIHLWTNAPGRLSSTSSQVEGQAATSIDILSSGTAQQGVRRAQNVAYPVRCIKE